MRTEIPIWFFIGVLLSVYGALVLGYGIFEMATGNLAHVEMAYLHTPIWWGAILLAIGVFYLLKFHPTRGKK
jgi:uncharacterized membrane protein